MKVFFIEFSLWHPFKGAEGNFDEPIKRQTIVMSTETAAMTKFEMLKILLAEKYATLELFSVCEGLSLEEDRVIFEKWKGKTLEASLGSEE